MENFKCSLFVAVVFVGDGGDVGDEASVASENNNGLVELSGGVWIVIGKIDFSDGNFAVGV